MSTSCGDGIVDSGEQCDDGNILPGDGCNLLCQREVCGNGIVDMGEECDDGNTAAADGCSDACRAEVVEVEEVIALAAGASHTCALLDTGSVRCWGWNDDGQLGYGNMEDVGDDEAPASAGNVPLGGSAIQLAAGALHTCALLAGGSVRCWGGSYDGQLGYGNTERIGDDEAPASAGEVALGGLATQLAAGDYHMCALMETGSVRCWGDGEFGQLGYGNTENIGNDEAPAAAGEVALEGLAIQLTAGRYHTCALMETGSVRCWGEGEFGQLGYGNTKPIGDDEAPASAGDVPLGGAATHLTAGWAHTCALMETGSVRCWGSSEYGQLGYGNTENIGDDEAPAVAGEVPLGGIAIQLVAGRYHTCALMETGSVRCWGASYDGQLGYGNLLSIGDDETPASAGDVPILVEAGGVLQLAAGTLHTCALLGSGSVRCWGEGDFGQLGYGNPEDIGDNELPASAGDVPWAAPPASAVSRPGERRPGSQRRGAQ